MRKVGRLPKCSTDSFHRKVEEHVPEDLMPALLPVIDAIAELRSQIQDMERWIEELAATVYPETALLTQVSTTLSRPRCLTVVA